MPFLKIRDLKYVYPNTGIRGIDGLDLDAERGELLAIVGPNAAGKSTLARLLKGLLVPQAGSISIAGLARGHGGPDPRVGILFSNPENQLITSLVVEDVAFGLEVAGEAPAVIEARVSRVLQRLGIAHLGARMPHLLSGGEQQMAALAGILVLEPEILILDEPTTYLDPDARGAVLGFMRQLADHGHLVLLVTHDMREAALADRVLVLDRGRAALCGTPEEVFARPSDLAPLDIFPPFLFRIYSALKGSGSDLPWPCSVPSLATYLAARTQRGSAMAVCLKGQEGRPPDAVEEGGGAALAFKEVGFGYDAGGRTPQPVLIDVNFSLRKGDLALLCGANGSGKSTLLQMANGLLRPDRGEVLVNGIPLSDLAGRGRGIPSRVALLFQNPERQLFSETVYDDIAFGPRNLGLPDEEVRRRVLAASLWVGLPENVHQRPVYSLSGGQMRRAAVAGVLAMEPEVLVLDEPTDGLDPGGVREFFKRVHEYGLTTETTILMASHGVPEDVSGIRHFGHLQNGTVRSSGPPEATLTGPGRTVPPNFLPDHLLLAEELASLGFLLPENHLDPLRAENWILGILGGRPDDPSGENAPKLRIS